MLIGVAFKSIIEYFLIGRIIIIPLTGVALTGLGIYLYFDIDGSIERVRSLVGIIVLFGFGYVFSNDRKNIKWRPVVCGACLQFMLGFFCIRSELGRSVFECIGKKVVTFLNYTNEGSKFVYGSFLIDEKGIFAFKVTFPDFPYVRRFHQIIASCRC